MRPLLYPMIFQRVADTAQPEAFVFERQAYTRFEERNRAVKSADFPWDEALLALLARLQRNAGDVEARARVGVVLRDFLKDVAWDIPEEDLTGEPAPEQGPSLLTISAGAAELYALPWELATLPRSGGCLADVPHLLLRYTWPGMPAAPAQQADARAPRILFAWSAKGGAVPADGHLRAIREAIRQRGSPDVKLDEVEHVSGRALEEAIAADTRPLLLHILCHGTLDGSREPQSAVLQWNDATDPSNVDAIDVHRFRNLLSPCRDRLRLVVLCACLSGDNDPMRLHLGSLAQAIHRLGIPAVVASRYPLSTRGSVRLTRVLYNALLVEGASLEVALLQARAALRSERGPAGEDAPGDACGPCDEDAYALQLYSRCVETVMSADGKPAERPITETRPFPRPARPSNAKARVAIVAVAAELLAERAAVARRLGGMNATARVVEIDAAAADAAAAAEDVDFRLVLMGARTGGSDLLGKLLDRGASGIRVERPDTDAAPDEEIAPGRALRRRIPTSFVSTEEAAGRAAELFETWLREWAPRERGLGGVPEPWEKAYLSARFDKWQTGTFGGLQARAGNRRLDRARLYVSLRGTVGAIRTDEEEGRFDEGARLDQRLNPLFLEQIVSEQDLPYLVIEGEAGSGKTVLLQHVAYSLACRHLDRPPPEAVLDEAGLEHGAPLLRVPVLVEAKRLAAHLRRGEAGELPNALAAELQEATGDAGADEAAVADGLRAGRYLVLVDSLDEVPGSDGRERVVACLAAVAAMQWPCRIVLTTRPTAHTGVRIRDRGLAWARISALNPEAVVRLVARWTVAMGKDEAYRHDLLEAVRHVAAMHPEESDANLVANPLLLTCTMLVYDQQRLLPDSTAALFERMVAILCDRKPSTGFPAERKREALERIFEAIQEAGGTSRPAREVAEVLLAWMPNLGTVDRAIDLLDRLGEETGLLRFEAIEGRGKRPVRVVRPWHRSFQQFLVACRLASTGRSVAEETDRLFVGINGRLARVEDPEWEAVLAFLPGVQAQRGSERARDLVRRLLDHGLGRVEGCVPARRGRILGLAAKGLAEHPDVLEGDPLRDALRQEIARWFATEGEHWPLNDRLLALEALGRLGDPRLDGDPWVEIEGGRFTMGEEGAFQSVPPHVEKVQAFRMFHRPVTVQDYAPFVEGNGYKEDAWWTAGRSGDALGEPGGWSGQRFHPNRPVVGVSWFEAMAFCRWATNCWGIDVDLPSEVEWELAARGREGRTYAWGNEDPGAGDDARANHRWRGETIDRVSPVGAFPRGNRGGLVDLTGNVWEWCHDPWSEDGRPEAVDAAGRRGAPRVVRGGSRSLGPWFLRCAVRSWNHPGDWHDDLGFRVVCRGSRPP